MIRFLMILLIGMLILNSCYKDDSRPWDEKQAIPVNTDNLVAKSNFDWKTTKKYQITIKGKINHVVKITSSKGEVYQKVFLLAGIDCSTTIILPAYEKSIHLIYNDKDIVLQLSSSTLTYSF